MKRCEWADTNSFIREYHDREWGVPFHDDNRLFELLILEGAQAGLSWSTILKKRDNYIRAYDHFDPHKVSRYTVGKINQLLKDPGIVRNRLKIQSSVTNARAFLKVQKEFGSFDTYIWGFVGGRPVTHRWKRLEEIPSHTRISDVMSRDLKKRGFKFVGPTICYAFMQSAGMVNDHTVDCFRYREVSQYSR